MKARSEELGVLKSFFRQTGGMAGNLRDGRIKGSQAALRIIRG